MSLEDYFPIFLFIIISIGLCTILLLIGKLLGLNDPNPQKGSPFECGFAPFEDARKAFDVSYYMIAILFVIFDVEIAFLFPWGLCLRDVGWPGFFAMFFFMIEFLLAYVYLWRSGALEWK